MRGEARTEAGADEAAVDEARKERDTLGGVVEVRAQDVPPGLGSYATKEERLDARLAAALMGIQAVKGVEIGEGFGLAALRGHARSKRRVGKARNAPCPRGCPPELNARGGHASLRFALPTLQDRHVRRCD